MNIMSVCGLAVAFSYAVIITQRTKAKMDMENVYTILVCICLGWMAFCEAFFYSAATKEYAWIWHQIGALGWSGFIGVTSWYFLEMGGVAKRIPTLGKLIYWICPIAITFRFVFFRPTAIAQDFVQSGSGLGWTFVNSFHNIWTYIFLTYVLVYLGGIFVYLYFLQKKEEKSSVRHLTRSFVILDVTSLVVGCTSYFVVPHFNTYIPPMGWIALLIFLLGYRMGIWKYDLSHFELVIDPQAVLDSSIEPMMITDSDFHILYTNRVMNQIFQEKEILGLNLIDLLPLNEQLTFQNIDHIEQQPIHNMPIDLQGNKSALVSINTIETRRNHQEFYMISMHDISQITQNQKQMEHMAYYDELTGLANRRKLGELLDKWEKRYRATGKDFALVFLDLNDFKSINDEYGHDAGDLALVSVSDMLQKIKQEEDEAFRLSGDEFVLLHLMKPNEKLYDMTHSIKREIRKINTRKFADGRILDASVGTCLYSEYENVRRLMKAADERMYEMKRVFHRKQK